MFLLLKMVIDESSPLGYVSGTASSVSNVMVTFGSVLSMPSIAFGGAMPKSVMSSVNSPVTSETGVLAARSSAQRHFALHAGNLQHADAP